MVVRPKRSRVEILMRRFCSVHCCDKILVATGDNGDDVTTMTSPTDAHTWPGQVD